MDRIEEKLHRAMERLGSYERAMIASRLVSDQFFDATDAAVRSKDKTLFFKTCEEAKIPDDLTQHMWKIVDAAYDTVYAKHNPNPIW
jgi:hypothetical protein